MWDTYPKGATPDWDQAFSGFQSAVDWPSTYYWQDIARHYPDAKVLLTLRSAESWWASYSNTVLNHITSLKGSGSWVDNMITQAIMQGHPDDRDTAIAAFNANNAQVRALVPRERLVVHELGDGWGPLCDAFGLPTPAEPYPVTNSTADFQAFHAARNATAKAATQKTT